MCHWQARGCCHVPSPSHDATWQLVVARGSTQQPPRFCTLMQTEPLYMHILYAHKISLHGWLVNTPVGIPPTSTVTSVIPIWTAAIAGSRREFPTLALFHVLTRCPLLAPAVSPPPLMSLPACHPKKPRPRSLPPICPRLQRLGSCSGGFLSPTSRLDAGGSLGHGRCSAHDR